MVKNIFWKGLIIGIIVLFVSLSVIPSTTGDIRKKDNAAVKNEQSSIFQLGVHLLPSISRNLNEDIVKGKLVLNKDNSLLPLDDPSWQWAKSAGGPGWDEGLDVAVDTNGNSYITGWFSGTATFGSTTLISQGYYDVFIAKLNNNGEWQWAKSAGGTGYDYGYSIAVDTAGNSYITGFFYGIAMFGNTTLTCQGVTDIFVAKLNNNGEWQWAKRAGGTNYRDGGFGVAVDTAGNCYITGEFYSSASFGSTTLVSHGYFDVFIAKLNTNGEWQWAKNAGGASSDEGLDVVVDTNGNSYITGDFLGTASFGSTTLVGQGDYDVFIAKLNTNGEWQWAKSAGGTGYDYGYSIAVDTAGNSYITGRFQGTATFGITTLISQGYYDVFIAKLNNNGEWQWAKNAGGTGYDYGEGIAVDTGGNNYITGYFQDTATFGNTKLVDQGSGDVFIAKLNTNGDWIWAKKAGGIGFDIGHDIAVDTNGTNYITGQFWGTATFGNTTLVCQGEGDVFVAKLSDSGGNQPPNKPIIDGPSSGVPGSDYTYFFMATDPNADNIFFWIERETTSERGWDGPYPSGTTINRTYSWSNQGNYTISCKLKDEFDLESEWSYFEVTIPRNKSIQNTMSLWFLERYPILHWLFQRLIGLQN